MNINPRPAAATETSTQRRYFDKKFRLSPFGPFRPFSPFGGRYYHSEPSGPPVRASGCCNTESAALADGIPAPDIGAMACKEGEARHGAMHNGASRAVTHADDGHDVANMDWATNDREELLNVKEKAIRDTYSWIFSATEFQGWRRDSSTGLWWRPGSGKKVLLAFLSNGPHQKSLSNELPTGPGSTRRFSNLRYMLAPIQASDFKRDVENKPEDTIYLDYGCDQHASSIGGYGGWTFEEISSLQFDPPDPSPGLDWTDWARLPHHMPRYRQHAANQHQFPERLLRQVASSRSSWLKNSERYQYKNTLVPLVLVTYPCFASAALTTMASEVFYQQVPRKQTFQNARKLSSSNEF